MTTQEIKIAGFRLFEQTAVAKMNVFNGCFSDKKIVDQNMPRLIKMLAWFEENNLMSELENFATGGRFNKGNLHFHANKLFAELTKY